MNIATDRLQAQRDAALSSCTAALDASTSTRFDFAEYSACVGWDGDDNLTAEAILSRVRFALKMNAPVNVADPTGIIWSDGDPDDSEYSAALLRCPR